MLYGASDGPLLGGGAQLAELLLWRLLSGCAANCSSLWVY